MIIQMDSMMDVCVVKFDFNIVVVFSGVAANNSYFVPTHVPEIGILLFRELKNIRNIYCLVK